MEALVIARFLQHGDHCMSRWGTLNDPERGPVSLARDDGRSITMEHQLRMFGYFSRGRNSRSPGSGIGLAYANGHSDSSKLPPQGDS
jgi:hypothetical protein